MTKKDLLIMVSLPLWVALATKVFFPQLWPLGLIALSLTVSSAVAVITALLKKPRLQMINFLLGGISVIVLSFVLGHEIWLGIPILTIVGIVCIISLEYGSKKETILSLIAVASYLTVTSVIVLSWAATTAIRWTITIPHSILLLVVILSVLLSVTESDVQNKEN